MQITFLGTSSGAPSLSRNMAGLVLRLPQKATLWMFDCGEGTQHQALRARVRLSHLERVFISHLHGDHIFGLPGLLASRSLQVSGTSPVTLYGPQGLEEFVRTALRISETVLSYPLEFVVANPGQVYAGDGFTVHCAPAAHRIEAYAYAVQEDDLPGTFDDRRARELGIPFGPLYGRLKAGGTIVLEDGREINGRDLVGDPRSGRRLVYTGDTMPTPELVTLASGADVLIHEATYMAAEAPLAERAAHSTALAAAVSARQAGVGRLILTHFSARYEGTTGGRMDDLLNEARQVFPATVLASDLTTFTVDQRAE